MPLATSLLVFLGTYTPAGGDSRGIYVTRFDCVSGTLSEPVLAAPAVNPTFLALHPDGKTLYALTEKGTFAGRGGGAVAAFRLDPAAGTLLPLDTMATGGGALAHLNVDGRGKVAAVVSYHASQIASFPIHADGSLGEVAGLISVEGPLGPHRQRQDKPHPHSLTFSPDSRFVYACDLGRDSIDQFQVDAETGRLTQVEQTRTTPGAGPRHSKFSADGKFFYVINELNGTIGSYAVDATSGALRPLGTVPTLPPDFQGENTCAEIRLSADGRFVYGSNRGHDSLVVFARDAGTGLLTHVQTLPCGGKHPRNFNLTPDGRWLLCANRDSNNLVVFRVDPATGRLSPTGQELKVPQAVCVLFVPTT